MTNTTLVKLDYFCDNTIKRYTEQVIRAFSGFQYMSFPSGVPTLNVVPCLADQSDALVATLINKASDTTAPTVPIISVTMTGIEMRRNDVQCLTHISTVQVVERKLVNGAYTSDQGRAYSVDRLMPRPFMLGFDIDVWTSNKDQKYQLLEQMLTLITPSIQIQSSENPIDWASMTSLDLESINWASAAGPLGNEGSRVDYFTLKVQIPIWLSPPAKVNQRRRIEQIVTNIFSGHSVDGIIEGEKMAQVIVSPGDHWLNVGNNSLTLLNAKCGLNDDHNAIFDWAQLIKLYGNLRPGTSTIHLSTTDNIEDTQFDIVGTIDYDSSALNKLVFTPDPATIPANTLANIDGLIHPRSMFPGNKLPNQTIGQRYLVTQSITGPTIGWGTLSAEANDIIEFDGSNWTVAYRPGTGVHFVRDYVTNSFSGRQLVWTGGDDGWMFTYDRNYAPGYWRLHI